MFGFKASFWNEAVYIDGRYPYRSNEILTACLNTPLPEAREWISELKGFKTKLHLSEGYDLDDCLAYDAKVQKAQRLLLKIGKTVRAIPPYDRLLADQLSTDLLIDLLNRWPWMWERDPNASFILTIHDEDEGEVINEYGFTVQGIDGHHRFYYQHFEPDLDALNGERELDDALDMEQINTEIWWLLDEFINLLQDLLRVQNAYADFLEHYLHREDCFLAPERQAEQLAIFLAASRGDALASPGSMRMRREPLDLADGRRVLAETVWFDSLGAFLYLDFFRGLERNYLPRPCANCGRWFLLAGGKYSRYCERPLVADANKTCRDVGARQRYDAKCKTDPVWQAYNRAYKAHYARYMKKKMTTAEFEQWSSWAARYRDQALTGEVGFEDYQKEIRK